MPAFGFITYSAAFGIGPERDHDDYVLVSGVGAPIAQLLRGDGHMAVAADDEPSATPALDDGPLSSATVLSVEHVQQALAGFDCRALIPFKSNARLEQLAGELGIRLLAAPAQLVRQLENKLQLPAIAAAAGVRIAETRTVQLNEALLDEVDALGLPRIFQPAVGFAGAGTRTVHDAGELAELVAGAAPGAVGKLVAIVEGEPLTVNGVVCGDQLVLVGAVTRQLTGVAGCTAAEFGSCGNDWSLPPASTEAADVRQLAHRVGLELARRGFRGLFGIDAVFADAGAVLIEINPRCTASLSLQFQLQQHDGGPTLLDAHLHAFDQPAPVALTALRDRFDLEAEPQHHPQAASVIIFNPLGEPVQLPPLRPGIYGLGASNASGESGAPASFVRSGYRFDQLAGQQEFLLLPQPAGRPVPAGAEIARLVVAGSVAESPLARSLTPAAAAIVDATRLTLEL